MTTDAPQQPPGAAPVRTWRSARASALFLVIGSGLLVLIAGVLAQNFASAGVAVTPQVDAPAFVGSDVCGSCHQPQAQLWQASQHRHAMAHASEHTVRGDFDNARFDYAGTRSRFFRKHGQFWVETDGPDGQLGTFQIKYTFGVEPLQQYLIAFPDGRVQALSIAWDSRAKEQGGQRWFHLYPDGNVTSADPLHWTRLNQNWNFMCAECHSTGVRKNYDPASNQFATTFAEISVGCEACHGAGARHVAWARQPAAGRGADNGLLVQFDERRGVGWSAEQGTPQRSAPPAPLRKEVETCGLCHARRGQLSEHWRPGRELSDTHRVTLIDRRLFHADGQIRDHEETYNYAPFKQSRMFASGVTCSDCHDPHSAALKAPGDGVCTQCHLASRYDASSHRRHSAAAPRLACQSCHMPERRYMVVDRRHDHGFRVPRPDLSMRTGAPNACNDCHQDKSAAWAADAIAAWFGPQRRGAHAAAAEAFHAAWSEAPDAQARLIALAASAEAPAITRASALAELPAADLEVIKRALADPDALVRLAALERLERVRADLRWSIGAALLRDPVAGVRIRAAELLAALPPEQRPAADLQAFASAAAEFIGAQQLNADRPEARTALAGFFLNQSDRARAEAEYRAALGLDSSFAPAAINLSDLYRLMGREHDGEQVLRAALIASPHNGSLHHTLGLALVRQKRYPEAVEQLRHAARLEPDNARYGYVLAVGLNSLGQRAEALAVLRDALDRHPSNVELLSAALNFSYAQGDRAAALTYAERLARLAPMDARLANLIRELKRQ